MGLGFDHMTRDYAKKRRVPRRSASASPWLWGGGGALLGLLCAVFLYWQLPHPVETDPPVWQWENKSAKNGQWDFYTLLPQMHLEEEIPSAPESKAEKAAPPPLQRYLLQVGAFRTEKQAEALKAKLALVGLLAKINRGQNADKTEWYRVTLGPFQRKEEILKHQRLLEAQGIRSFIWVPQNT